MNINLIDEPNLCFRDLDFDTSCSSITNTYIKPSYDIDVCKFSFSTTTNNKTLLPQ